MVIPNMPTCPSSLKGIQHYLNIASEHDGRDVAVSYWCRMYATQQGLKIDKSSPAAKELLVFLMDWLEMEKKREKDNDTIAHDIPAQAYIENYALKLFMRADQQDRAGIFNKNVVKAFYTSGMLYAMLEMFGELTEEVSKNQKYAKWKAAYIHNCLKNGETPVPGPADGDDFQEDPPKMGFTRPDESEFAAANTGNTTDTTTAFNTPDLLPSRSEIPSHPGAIGSSSLPLNIPPDVAESSSGPITEAGVPLNTELVAKAQKLCKYASSALNYDDVPTAVSNLRKALALLTTGKDE